MEYSLLMQLVSLVIDWVAVHGKSNGDKDLEILVLRYQVRLLQRKLGHQPRLSSVEKLLFAVLAVRFKTSVDGARSRLAQSLLLFKPETLFK